MTVHAKPLASVILSPTRSIILPTTAGHSVRFQQGTATVVRTEDLPYVLARPDARVMVSTYAMSWMPEVLNHTRKIEAQVQWPEGYGVEHRDEHDWDISLPLTYMDVEPADVNVLTAEPETVTPPKGKQWRKPPSS